MTHSLALVSDGLDSVTGGARFLGVSRSTLYKLMERGQLAFAKIGKSRRIPRRALIELAERNLKGGWAVEETAGQSR